MSADAGTPSPTARRQPNIHSWGFEHIFSDLTDTWSVFMSADNVKKCYLPQLFQAPRLHLLTDASSQNKIIKSFSDLREPNVRLPSKREAAAGLCLHVAGPSLHSHPGSHPPPD